MMFRHKSLNIFIPVLLVIAIGIYILNTVSAKLSISKQAKLQLNQSVNNNHIGNKNNNQFDYNFIEQMKQISGIEYEGKLNAIENFDTSSNEITNTSIYSFKFHGKPFILISKWFDRFTHNKILWTTDEQFSKYKSYQDKTNKSIFFYFSIANTKGNPINQYLIPLKSFKYHFVSKRFVQPYASNSIEQIRMIIQNNIN